MLSVMTYIDCIRITYEEDELLPGQAYFAGYYKAGGEIFTIVESPEDVGDIYYSPWHYIPFHQGEVWVDIADYWDYGLDRGSKYFDTISGPLIWDGKTISVVGLDLPYEEYFVFIDDFYSENEQIVLLLTEYGDCDFTAINSIEKELQQFVKAAGVGDTVDKILQYKLIGECDEAILLIDALMEGTL